MLRRLELIDVGPAPRLSIELGRRLNVFAGDNGLGKSFVLEVVWWVLTNTWAELPIWPRPGAAGQPLIALDLDEAVVDDILSGLPRGYTVDRKDWEPLSSAFQFSEQEWSILPLHFQENPLPAMVLYARADGSFAVWDPARNHYKLRPKGRWGILDSEILEDPGTLRRPPAYVFRGNTVWNGLESHGKSICSGLIRDWVSWQRQSDPGSPGRIAFDHLRRTLEALSPNPDAPTQWIRPGPPTRVFIDDTREFPTIDCGYGNVPVIYAAAGMRRIIALAYLIVWSWREHVEASRLLRRPPVQEIVFLMDEVETHLHPQWQRRILPRLVDVLLGLAPHTRVQAFLTTHAPLVLASLEPIFNPDEDRFFVFSLEDGLVSLNLVPWAKQGDAVDWLVSPAFNLQQARSVEAERVIEDAEAFMRGDVPQQFKTREEIDAELHRVLSGDDIFWPRWIGPFEEHS